jgi:hypothetical protein
MYNKAPKNKNITVRVTEKQHDEFTRIAHENGLSVSGWANHILNKHKDSYRKKDPLEILNRQADLASLKKELIDQLLKKLHIENKTSNQNQQLLEILQLKFAKGILNRTEFKYYDDTAEQIRNYHSVAHHLST